MFGEYNFASGDDTETVFAALRSVIPDRHDKYGLADQWDGRTCAICGRRGGTAACQARVGRQLDTRSGWRAPDALYSASGAVLARIPNGAPDRHVGQELDIQATYTPSPRIQLHGGYAHIFTGPFLKAATPGRSYSAPYVMVTTMLLGLEK